MPRLALPGTGTGRWHLAVAPGSRCYGETSTRECCYEPGGWPRDLRVDSEICGFVLIFHRRSPEQFQRCTFTVGECGECGEYAYGEQQPRERVVPIYLRSPECNVCYGPAASRNSPGPWSSGPAGTPARYRSGMSSEPVPGGVVHALPADLREALLANPVARVLWDDITPLARNEFICWVEDAKQKTTRVRRIRRTQEELEQGQRRPCCWPGCKHRERTD